MLTVMAVAAGCEKEDTKPEREDASSFSETSDETSVNENDSTEDSKKDDSKNSSNKNKTDSSSVSDAEKKTESKNSDEGEKPNSDNSETGDNNDYYGGDNDKTVGDTDMSTSEWLDKAQSIYNSAARTRFNYICTSNYFDCDYSDMKGDGRWVRVTNCDTLEEASAEYYSVFAESGHESDLDNYLTVIEGELYCSDGARGKDITYQGTEVTEITDSSDDTITFKVVSTYDDRTEENEFSLVYERGAWYVEDFKMPY